jgi:hypothetical protein
MINDHEADGIGEVRLKDVAIFSILNIFLRTYDEMEKDILFKNLNLLSFKQILALFYCSLSVT